MKIVCVGDCGIDHYLPGNQRVFGGISANFARQGRRCFAEEHAIHLVSVVGDDDGGKIASAALAGSGIHCHIRTLPGSTPVQRIEVQADGERQFVGYETGVLNDFRIGADERQLIADSDLLVVPVYLQIVGLFDEIMSVRAGDLVAVDFADFLQHPEFGLLEKHIAEIDIGFFGLGPDDFDTIGRIAALAKQHGKLFVVTLGAAGSRAYTGGMSFDCPAVPVAEVVDTTGAGDAFAAAFLAAYCNDGDIETSLRRGAELAAEVVQQHGAFPPTASSTSE